MILGKYHNKKIFFVLSLVLFIVSNNVAAPQKNNVKDEEWDDCKTELKLGSLWVKKLKARCAEIEHLKSKKADIHKLCSNRLNVDQDSILNTVDANAICARQIEAAQISADSLSSNRLNVWKQACVGSLSSQSICTNTLNSNRLIGGSICTKNINVAENGCITDLLSHHLCAQEIAANTGCMGTLHVNNLLACGVYRATAVYSANTMYTLGNDLDFDAILDDPNGDLVAGPTRYTAPVSGYYLVTLQIDQHGLAPNAGFGPILGVPVSNPALLVNGDVFRQVFTSYLTFLNRQQATLTTILHLFQGDVVTLRFAVVAGHEALGFVNVPGTVVVQGNGTTENASIFQIHLLSVDCFTGPLCPPCGPTGLTGCLPCPTGCVPCQPTEVIICIPQQPENCSFKPCPNPCCKPCNPDENCPNGHRDN